MSFGNTSSMDPENGQQSGTGRKTYQQIWMEIPSNLTVSQF